MSITRMSRPGPFGSAPRQSTSKSNCCTAFCTMRPRQVSGASAPGRRNPMDMAGRPWFVSGMRAPPDAVGKGHTGRENAKANYELDVKCGSPAVSRPRSFGIEGPKMSRSRTPTRARWWAAREKARFTLEIDVATCRISCGNG